jgi:small subunit ribosomal protein S7
MEEIKVFGKWSCEGIEVNDPGLRRYITLESKLVPKSRGRFRAPFHKSKMHIVERLICHLMVPGHRGKKHLLSSGHCCGKWYTAYKLVKEAFEILEKVTKKNPIEVFVRAIENVALREELTSFQVGGIIVRKAVITSPQRRIDLALRLMVQGAYQKAHQNPKGFARCLAEEILAAYQKDIQNSYALREKERIEREAAGAR